MGRMGRCTLVSIVESLKLGQHPTHLSDSGDFNAWLVLHARLKGAEKKM